MHILIVEDEALLAKQLRKLIIAIYPQSEISGTNSISETVTWLAENDQPDLIFMDIELADGQSFEIFEKVQIKSPVIFTTAYDEYALKAFKVNSIDYLLKPIQSEDIIAAINKLKELRHTSEQENLYQAIRNIQYKKEDEIRERILVKQGQKMITIHCNDVGYFFTQHAVTYLIAKDKKKHMIDYTLDQLEQSLDPKKFFRVNRQYIVAYTIIQSMHQWFNGKLKIDINLPLETPIIVSRDKAPLLKNWLGG